MEQDRHYQVVSHAQVPELARQVLALETLCFATYPGVLRPSLAHTEWYLRRPGMDVELSSAALCDGQMVCSLFVSRAHMRLGGQIEEVGLLDTVMTHPEHRQRGLARIVLARAIGGMPAGGLAASALCTLQGSMPSRLYQSLGYREVEALDFLQRTQPATSVAPGWEPATPDEGPTLRAWLDDHFAGHEGYQPYHEALWRWRKLDRPPDAPVEHWALRRQGALAGFATLCHAPIIGAPGERCHILTDFALAPTLAGPAADEALETLLARAPAGETVIALAPQGNAGESAWWRAHGFGVEHVESVMALPLQPRLRAALGGTPSAWHTTVETIIGV